MTRDLKTSCLSNFLLHKSNHPTYINVDVTFYVIKKYWNLCQKEVSKKNQYIIYLHIYLLHKSNRQTYINVEVTFNVIKILEIMSEGSTVEP